MNIYWQIAIGVVCIAGIAALIILYLHYLEYKKSSGGKPLTLRFLFAYSVFLILLPVILSSLLFFWIFCLIISLLLTIRYGCKFAGLLHGTDAIHTLDRNDISKNVGNTLFIIKYQEDGTNNFYDTIREAILKRFAETPVKTPKLWYTWHQFLGYSYYLKNQITAEECVRKLGTLGDKEGEEISKNELVKLLSKYSNTTLPKNHTALWEVLIGTQPVKWKTDVPNDREKYYPVVLRIQHCLSDATQLLKGFVRIFGDVKSTEKNGVSKQSSNAQILIKLTAIKTFKITSKPLVYLWRTLELIIKTIYAFIMIPPILLVQGMIKAADNNILHGPPLSGEKHLVFGIEESPYYIQAIKRIKNRIPETAFSEVLLAAISASFSEYFQKNSKLMPETVAAMVPVFPGSAKLAHFIPQKHKVKKMVCRNKFSLAVFNLPVRVSDTESCGKCNAINSRLNLVKQQSTIFKNSIDFRVNYMILSLFVGVLPFAIRKFLSRRYHTTFMVSIIPAPPAITALGGYPIQDVVFWVPNRGPIGMGYSIFSYDGRFQMGVIVDKALIPEEKDVQNMVDGIYKYLDLLNVETDCSRV